MLPCYGKRQHMYFDSYRLEAVRTGIRWLRQLRQVHVVLHVPAIPSDSVSQP